MIFLWLPPGTPEGEGLYKARVGILDSSVHRDEDRKDG